MTHLSENDLLHLAATTSEGNIYNEYEIQQMNHLKDCENCYESFCRYLVLLETTSDEGYEVLADAFNLDANCFEDIAPDSVIAALQIVTGKIADRLHSTIKQLDQSIASLIFEPAAIPAVRGGSGKQNNSVKLQNIDNQKTYILYDPDSDTLYVQIDKSDLPDEDFIIYLICKDNKRIPIELLQRGKYLQGVVKQINCDNFTLYIEYKL